MHRIMAFSRNPNEVQCRPTFPARYIILAFRMDVLFRILKVDRRMALSRTPNEARPLYSTLESDGLQSSLEIENELHPETITYLSIYLSIFIFLSIHPSIYLCRNI